MKILRQSNNIHYVAITALATLGTSCVSGDRLSIKKLPDAQPRNVIFILSDDHRYDYMGFLNAIPWLQTPNMDLMAANGAYIQNAFVTTSLSSPSRASILTGLFSHEHTVVDNQAPVPDGLIYFPQYLQKAGYRTAFFGKWHMGDSGDQPQPGFDHWESFKGQGTYYNVKMNVNGEQVAYPETAYITDLLTDHAIEFIKSNRENPFFVYLSHKAVHDPFEASQKNTGIYSDEKMPKPANFYTPTYGQHTVPSKDRSGEPAKGVQWYGANRFPDWVKAQRESWHGVDYSYFGRTDWETEAKRYCETLTSLDESIGRVLQCLRENGMDQNTLVIYMGDNGFCWGEHGLIDKRTFYEASVRVPMLAYCPQIIEPGTVVRQMVQNIDIAPTVMEACGIAKAEQMRGESMLPLLKGEQAPNWRQRIYYEYYWEYDFPQTPTTFGVRTDKYKYIRYHGIWDTNEFYDLEADPYETTNLIASPEHQQTIKQLTEDLYSWLEGTGGMNIPLKRTVKFRHGDHRNLEIY
ncbi:acetylglucosamine-6-sulfatase [Bacteroidia bacterium]|nr:acetylglucosamine-6-sulfatase [Bacteroidia bacterium]